MTKALKTNGMTAAVDGKMPNVGDHDIMKKVAAVLTASNDCGLATYGNKSQLNFTLEE